MKVSITAVSANRQMTKTLVRASERVNRLREAFSHLDASDEPFDTLQFVLMDRPSDFIHLHGTRGDDRLFQVHVGASELPCGPGREIEFVAGLARTIRSAVMRLPISDSTVHEMEVALDRVNTEPPAGGNAE